MKRVLIIGVGGIGKRHLRGFLKTGRARVSVCEIDQTKLEDAAATYDVDETYSNLETVPLDKFDLAVIAAPAHVHVSIGQRLAEANMPFLTEKPLSVTFDGVDKLIETVRSKRVPVRVGYVRRSQKWIQRLKADLDAGRIGTVRMAYLNASQEFPKYRPDYQTTYYARRSMGGGAILDCASHFVDLLLWTMGSVREVSAMYDRLVLENVECEDSLLMNLRMTSGAIVNMTVNQFQKPLATTAEFIGTEGNLRLVDTEARLEMATDDSGHWESERFVEDSLSPMEVHESNFIRQAHDFMNVVDGEDGPMCTLEEARENLRVCLAAKESYRTRRIIRI